ncbi:DUF317 domain-containing protein [Streptomyces sp. RFCAC02]|uniref:DUF317 domain-containing protein n=1 Tax=Streptomyces sp. RFCAC02 TaxID=2499143 RepID=UPI001020AAA1|nr:DUF317 domain-containing protein [Streptomyces sp. RFCAC02]
MKYDLDGDVYVSPRHLAGTTGIGDPALTPLTDAGFHLTHDELGNAYCSSPDHRVRLGFLPEGADDGLWRITAAAEPFDVPAWAVSFNDACPTEFVTAFTTALAQAYTDGPHAYLAPCHLDMSPPIRPLLEQQWSYGSDDVTLVSLHSPDRLASLQYKRWPSNRTAELTTLDTRWLLQGGPTGSRWYASASSATPVELVTAITTSVADPVPLLRWKEFLARPLKAVAQLTPVQPTPTPLDIARSTRGATPPSITRWSTATPPRQPSTAPRR